MRRVLALVVLLFATGCTSGHHDGPDRPDPGADPDRAAIHDGLAMLFAGDHPTAADLAGGDCFARELVARVSPEQLREAGVLDASYAVVAELPVLDPRVGEAWVQAQFACVDYVEAAARAAVSVSHGTVDPGAYAACLRAALTGDELHDAVLATLTGSIDGPEVTALSSAQAACTQRATRR